MYYGSTRLDSPCKAFHIVEETSAFECSLSQFLINRVLNTKFPGDWHKPMKNYTSKVTPKMNKIKFLGQAKKWLCQEPAFHMICKEVACSGLSHPKGSDAVILSTKAGAKNEWPVGSDWSQTTLAGNSHIRPAGPSHWCHGGKIATSGLFFAGTVHMSNRDLLTQALYGMKVVNTS